MWRTAERRTTRSAGDAGGGRDQRAMARMGCWAGLTWLTCLHAVPGPRPRHVGRPDLARISTRANQAGPNRAGSSGAQAMLCRADRMANYRPSSPAALPRRAPCVGSGSEMDWTWLRRWPRVQRGERLGACLFARGFISPWRRACAARGRSLALRR